MIKDDEIYLEQPLIDLESEFQSIYNLFDTMFSLYLCQFLGIMNIDSLNNFRINY